jgi:serine/threonine protein kinase
MASISGPDWQTLSGHLDRVMALPEEQRAGYLVELKKSDPDTANRLAELLRGREHGSFAKFLSGSLLTEAPDTQASLVGRSAGPYVIDAQLGHGGMGSVWRAHRADGRSEGTVAIQFLPAAWPDEIGEQRFRSAGRLLGQLSHPNIARLLDSGVLDANQPYLVIEHVQGESIDAHCERHALDAKARVEVFLSVLAAVSHAHSHLIVHRDIRPANIVVSGEGTVKILDFGIATILARDNDGSTTANPLPLTPQYAAPEQLLGQSVTTGTDVYALGLVLYVLLTGKHPVGANMLSSAELIRRVVAENAPPASAMASIPAIGPRLLEGDLDHILAKALQKSPGERYPSAAAFAEDLRRYLNHRPVRARPDSVFYRAGKFLRRHRAFVSITVILSAVIVAAGIGLYQQKLTADLKRRGAELQAARVQESSRFLSSMVEEIGAEGGKLSPTDILDRGMYLLEHQTALEPRARVDELRMMGSFYLGLNEVQKERTVLARAEELARLIPYPEGLISILCDEVDSELDQGQRDKAQARLAEAQQLLAGVSQPSARLRAQMQEEAANVAAADDHNEAAVAHAQAALKILREGGAVNTALYAALLSRLSAYYDALGDAREAHRYTELAGAAWDATVGNGSFESLSNMNNESVDLINFGEVRAALTTSTEVLHRLEARGAGPAVQAPFRANYGARLAAMGRYSEAVTFLDQAIADLRASHNQFWQQRAQFFRACAMVHAGQADAPAALDEVDGAYGHDPVKNAAALHSIAVCRSEWLLSAGEVQAANEIIDSLLKEVGYPAQMSSPVLRAALPAAAKIALARQELSAAEAYASAAAKYARKQARDPNQSADVGRALLLLARTQHASGDDSAAIQSLQQALPALSGGLGPDHVEVSDARNLLQTLSPPRAGG